jgi:starch-binding outer membrane protein, SusD/RagB family
MKKIILYLLVVALVVPAISCEKYLEVKAPNQISDINELIQTPEDVPLVLNSAYDVMANAFDGDIQTMAEMLSDNAAEPVNNLDMKAVYDRETTFFNGTINGIYSDMYRTVFRVNLILNSIDNVPGVAQDDKARWVGEAKFLRALSHFYILKVYAQPFGYTADNSHLGIPIREAASATPINRSSVAACYAFIESDLRDAYDALPLANGLYATKDAAAALLSYVLWMQNKYQEAADFAAEIINSGRYTLHPDLDVFEAQDTTNTNPETPEGIFFAHSYLPTSDARNDYYRNYLPQTTPSMLGMSQEFLQFMQLNPVDKRYTEMVSVNSQSGQVNSLRFGKRLENNPFFSVPLLRLTVVKLIRAFSLIELNTDGLTAIGDLNDLRQRAFPEGVDFAIDPSTSFINLRDIVDEEFRKETFCEGLWIDVLRKRGAQGENVLIRSSPWNCPGMAIQFPNSEGTGAGFIFNPERGCN